jgi:hypothetical protein
MEMEAPKKMLMGEGGDKMRMKLMAKMEKYCGQIGESKLNLARAERMLAVADILIAQGASAQVPESAVDDTDMEIAEDIAELRMMSPEGLKEKRLKYLEKQAKYTRKVADFKMDLQEKTQEYEAMAQEDKMRMKLMAKMEKYRGQIGESEMKLARAERMLAVADILIAQGGSAQVPESAVDATDREIAEDIAEMRMMSPEGLKEKRLKYLEKQAKYTRKVANFKMDLQEKTQEYEAMAKQSALAS